MENKNKGNTKYDLILSKIFDIKVKQGFELKIAYIDEKKYLKTLYFLKDKKVFILNISNKKIEELNFTKSHEVLYITGNNNHTFLICIFRNCKIFAIDCQKNIIYFKNLQNVPINSDSKGNALKTEKKENESSMNDEKIFSPNLELWANENLNKIVIYTGTQIIIWYQSIIKEKISSGKKLINEAIGYHIYIQLQEERQTLLEKLKKKFESFDENVCCIFKNSYYLGSFIYIFYILLIPLEEKGKFYSKIIIVNYLFFFDKDNHFKSNDTNKDPNINKEFKTKFSSKYIYTYLINQSDKDDDDLSLNINNEKINSKKKICSKSNLRGTIIAIGINYINEANVTLAYYFIDTYHFTSYKIVSLFPNKKFKVWIEDIEWIYDDLFLLVQFSHGYLTILNTNFQVISFIDSSNSFTNLSNTDIISIPNTFLNLYNKIEDFTGNIRLLSSKNCARGNSQYFALFSNNNIIGFQMLNTFISYEDNLLNTNINPSAFDDFIYNLQYLQLHNYCLDSTKNILLFDKLHNFILMNFGEMFTRETANENIFQNENISSLIKSFIKFISIYRNLNLIHETNLSLLSYLIIICNDFFFYLLKLKEIWLAFLFIELSEKYILKQFRFKTLKNKNNEEQMLKNQSSYLIFHPYYIPNISLKCYNKITNYSLFSKLRLILIFNALIEFRNNQALNINVLYFILAKVTISKLKKHNLLDDINLILKVIIRNWKYLKSENIKAGGEEYVLNGLTMNQRAELLSFLLKNNTNCLTISRKNPYPKHKPSEFKPRIEFFTDFYSLDELQNFNPKNETYCNGDEDTLISEYNYMNNIGMIQKWILLFTNGLYYDLFEDYKEYLNNHLKQTVAYIINKKPENISPDGLNLSKIIYFNLFFFAVSIADFIESFLKFYINTKKIIYNKNEKFFSFVSPSNIPFIIYEFYAYNIEMPTNKKEDIDEIQEKEIPSTSYSLYCSLIELIKKNKMKFNITLNEVFDFGDFLLGNGFKIYTTKSNNDLTINSKDNSNGLYVYAILLFFIFLIHKFSAFYFLSEEHKDLIFKSIQILDIRLKREIYEMIFLILNGYVRYYIYKQIERINIKETLNPDEMKNFEIILSFYKSLLSKFIFEESFKVRQNIHELIAIVPDLIQFQFIENTLRNEYLELYTKFSDDIFSLHKDILNQDNFNKNMKVNNFFESLCSNNSSMTVLEIIFGEKFQDLKDNFKQSVSVIISLIFNTNKEYSFNFLNDSNTVLSIIQNKKNNFESYILFDNIIQGNIDKYKNYYKDSDYSSKLIIKIKIIIIRFIHLMNILYIKYKILTINPFTDISNYLKLFAFLLIFEKNEEKFYEHVQQLINCLNELYLNNTNEKIESKSILEILKFLYISLISRNNVELKQFSKFENSVKEKNSLLYEDYSNYTKTISILFEKLHILHSEYNEDLLLCLYLTNRFYMKTTGVVYTQMTGYANSINKPLFFKLTREKYVIFSEKFSNLTNIHNNSIIEFRDNWELIHNHPIYNMIITDKFKARGYFNKEKFEMMMTERQKNEDFSKYLKIGKKGTQNLIQRNIQYILDKTKYKEIIQDTENNTIESNSDNNNSHSTIVFDFHPLKIKYIDDEKDFSDSREDDLNNSIIHLNHEKVKNNKRKHRHYHHHRHRKYSGIELFIMYIKRVFFEQFLTSVFEKFRLSVTRQELEEISIFNVSLKDKKVYKSKLKEKFLSTKDMFHSDDYYNNLNFLKSFDVIKVNKHKVGISENSKFFADLVKNKKTKHIGESVKEKIKNIQDKISEYEIIMKNLNRDFNSLNK